MTVNELIARLKTLPPLKEVYFGSDEEGYEEVGKAREFDSGVYLER